MILIGFLAAVALAAFVAVVAGVHATERRQSFHAPSADGWAAQFARWVLGVRACELPLTHDGERADTHGDRV